MEKKGMTKKQFMTQCVPCIFNILMGIFWLTFGIPTGQKERSTSELVQMILWSVIIVFCTMAMVVLYRQWKRNPIVDEELDRQIVKNAKDGAMGAGIFLGLLVACTLLALSLVWLLK